MNDRDETYELVDPDPAPPPPAPRAAAGAARPPLPPPVPRAIPPKGKSAVERALEAREDEAKPSHLRQVVLPLVLLGVGLVGQAIGWVQVGKTPLTGVIILAIAIAVQAALFVPAAMLSMAMVARWFELGLGTLPSVLFRLAALTLGTAGLADVLFALVVLLQDFEPSTVVAGYGMYLVLLGVPLLVVMELSVAEMALAVLLMFLPRIAVIFVGALGGAEHFGVG